jgi:hypothetical protein
VKLDLFHGQGEIESLIFNLTKLQQLPTIYPARQVP